MTANLICEAPAETVRVVRFTKPDLRPVLYYEGHEHDDIARCELYKELAAAALDGLPEGGALVLNFGLIEAFPSAFYRLLLRLQTEVRARGGRLVPCAFSEHMKEAFAVMGGPKTFEPAHATESHAVAAAKK
jgi:anti-anti-sigma regulatory factor